MATNPTYRHLLPWAAAVLLSLAAAFGTIKTASIALERNFQSELDTEVKRRSLEIAAVTMSSNVMGSVAALGIINQAAKGVLRGVTPLDHPAIVETLQAIGESYHANGVFLVNSNGIVQSCWYTIGVTLTGVDVKFRPYFQIAMQGRQNVYAAIGTTTGQRALYFAAPVYDEASTRAPIVGAAVARLDVERIESSLKSWAVGPALLLSPQGVTYASNRSDLNEHLSAEKTPEQLRMIRDLKQFGTVFDSGTPRVLPFAIGSETVNFENQRYAVARAPVQWNDIGGEWTLVLLGDLDKLMPASRRATLGAASGALVLILSAFFLTWRRRLQLANDRRRLAERELKAHATKLEIDSSTKSYLAEISAGLHQAATLEDFARTFMRHVTPRIEADYGAFYALDEDSGLLTPVGGHGARASELEKVAIGQGLVGQCAKDMTPIVISDATQTKLRIVWGGGVATPRSVVLLPVAHAERLLGVLVLAALRPIDADKRALLDAMLPTVAMNLEILWRNLATRRQAETLQWQQTQLQETEAWYRGIFESAPDGMLVVDENGAIILANPRIDAMFGYSAGALVGQRIEALVPAAARARHVGLRASYTQSGSTRAMGTPNSQLRGVRKDGTEFPVEVGLSRLPALGGHGICVCASVRDITERKKAEQAMAEERAPAANT